MSTIAIDVNSKEDIKFFSSLAKRLNLKIRILTSEEKEDIAFAAAIDDGRKSGYVDEKSIKKVIAAVKHKKYGS